MSIQKALYLLLLGVTILLSGCEDKDGPGPNDWPPFIVGYKSGTDWKTANDRKIDVTEMPGVFVLQFLSDGFGQVEVITDGTKCSAEIINTSIETTTAGRQIYYQDVRIDMQEEQTIDILISKPYNKWCKKDASCRVTLVRRQAES